jgi:hypothetical protein
VGSPESGRGGGVDDTARLDVNASGAPADLLDGQQGCTPPDILAKVIAPLARTPAEANLYMDVKACPSCGGNGFSGTSVVMLHDGKVYERHTGTCEECGSPREFIFRMPEEFEIRLSPTDFGGPEPSELLDPGEWMTIAEVAASPEGGASKEDLAFAAAAVDEVLKFVPPDSDEIPRWAFHSRIGRDAYQSMPERYTRGRLTAISTALHEAANAPYETPDDTAPDR